VSSDSVWHWGGSLFPPQILAYVQNHFAAGFDRVPRLLADAGFTTSELDTIFVENPRRFLEAGR
jgi:predicted metal-dependent phosphotriesterase family hydrolase